MTPETLYQDTLYQDTLYQVEGCDKNSRQIELVSFIMKTTSYTLCDANHPETDT